MATETVTIVTSSDDCMSGASDYFENGYGNDLYIDDGDATVWHTVSWRFTNVDLTDATSITSATLTLVREADNGGDTGILGFRCEASNSPATFSTSDRPYNRTHRSAYVTHDFPNDGTTQSIDVTDIIQDLLDASYTYTGTQSIVISCGGANSTVTSSLGLDPVSYRHIGIDYGNGSNYASLEIVYSTETPGAGGGTLLVPFIGTVAAGGTAAANGAVSDTLDALTMAASGTVSPVLGAVTDTLADATMAASGALQAIGVVDDTLAELAMTGAGAMPAMGGVSATLDSLAMAASGALQALGSVSATLAVLVAGGVGETQSIGAVSATMEPLVASAQGAGVVDTTTGAVTCTFENLVLSGVGNEFVARICS